MDVKEFKMELEIGKELFYDESQMYGMYSCKPVYYTREIQVNNFGSFTVKGQTRRLLEGESYDITFDGSYPNTNPRYDDFYKIVQVEPERLDSVENQDKFLQAIITENQFNSLKNAYPDPNLLVDLILEDKIDTSKTKGIKEKSLAKIKFQVEQNAHISILIAKLNTLNLSTSSINKLLVHFKTSQAVIQAIDENIYNLCEVSSFGFLTVDKSAVQHRGDEPTNENRITACVTYLLKKHNSEGHTWSHRHEIVQETIELLNINQSFVEDMISKLKELDELYIDENRLARKHIREQEEEIRNHLWRIYSAYTPPSKQRVENRIGAVEDKQGFKFTEEQRDAILESSRDGVALVNGAAGTGKSTVIKGLVDSLGSDNYLISALSGKAVQVLTGRNIKASTIHRMLGYNGSSFSYDEIEPLRFDIYGIDEMSMVDVSLFLSILKAIPSGSKILLIGDSGQLPAVTYGDVFLDLLNSKAFPSYELTQVHRQAKKSGVLNLANSIRRGEQIMPYNSSGREVFGELEDQTVIGYSFSDKNNIAYDVLKIAQSYLPNLKKPEDIIDFQVIVTNRERGNLSVRNMNIELQKIFNDMDKPFLSRGNYNYRVGDKIIAQGNSYKLVGYNSVNHYLKELETRALVGEDEEDVQGSVNIYNGSMGIIKEICDKTALIQFENMSELIPFSQGDMDKIDMAYACTVHKMQGSGIENIVFAFDFSSYLLLSRQLLYTAITRASGKGVILCESNAMHQAIENDINLTRRTFLGELLIESMNNDK